MATPVVTQAYVEWKTEKVAQKVGRKPRLDPQSGEQMRSPKTNQLLWSPKTEEKDMEFPVLNVKAINDPSDLTWAIQEILDDKKAGFISLPQIVDYLNHGLKRGPAGMMNRGQDMRLSAAQIEALTTMVGVYKKGFITDIDQIVAILEKQGIPDARRELQVRLELDDPSDSDSDDDEAVGK